MKNIKTFNEMRNSNIHTGIELTPRQINYIRDGIDKEYLEPFEILVDDSIFYVKYFNKKWEFDRIQDLRDHIHLRYYIDTNEPDKVLEIITRNKNLNCIFENNWPIRWASYRAHTEVVKILLQDDRVDPSTMDNYAIRWASKNGHTEVVKLLLQDSRVDPSNWNNYAIIWASKNGHDDVVKLLIQHPKVRAKLTEKQIEEYEKS